MRKRAMLSQMIVVMTFLLGNAGFAEASTKALDAYTGIVVEPFDSSVQGAPGGLPEAVRTAVMQALKDAKLFEEVLTSEQAEETGTAMLHGRLVDFAAGNAAKRLMVGFGSGRAHARFEFTVEDVVSGRVVWKKAIKQTASFWFNSTTSSAAERAELPDAVAKKLVEEMKKAEK